MMSEPQPGAPAVTEVAGTATSAPTIDEMAAELAAEKQKFQSTLSDYERQMNDMFSQASQAYSSQQATLAAQIAQLQGQLQAVKAQAGPPTALLLAQSLAQRVPAIASAHPDLGALHFAGVTDQAARLADAVQAVTDGSGTVQEATHLAQAIGSWFTRSHPRASCKVLEGAHAALDEAERIIEELPSLVPAVTAIASVV